MDLSCILVSLRVYNLNCSAQCGEFLRFLLLCLGIASTYSSSLGKIFMWVWAWSNSNGWVSCRSSLCGNLMPHCYRDMLLGRMAWNAMVDTRIDIHIALKPSTQFCVIYNKWKESVGPRRLSEVRKTTIERCVSIELSHFLLLSSSLFWICSMPRAPRRVKAVINNNLPKRYFGRLHRKYRLDWC